MFVLSWILNGFVSLNYHIQNTLDTCKHFCKQSRTPWSCGLLCHVLDREVGGSNLSEPVSFSPGLRLDIFARMRPGLFFCLAESFETRTKVLLTYLREKNLQTKIRVRNIPPKMKTYFVCTKEEAKFVFTIFIETQTI